MASRIRPDGKGRTRLSLVNDRLPDRSGGLSPHVAARGKQPAELSNLRDHEEQFRGLLVRGDVGHYVGMNRFAPQARAAIELPFQPAIPPHAVIRGDRAPIKGARYLAGVNPPQADPLDDYAARISEFYVGAAPQVRARLEDLFGLSDFGVVVDRAKAFKSVRLKLYREILEGAEIKSIGDALEAINDGYGLKVVCRDATRRGMFALIARLIEKLPAEDLRIVRVRHYTGPAVKPYLDRFMLKEFELALGDFGYKPRFVSGKGGIKNSGYTSLQIDLEIDVYRNGARYPVKIDLHFRGEHVDRVNNSEHLIMAILRQKRSPDEALLRYQPFAEVVDSLLTLTPVEEGLFDLYLLDLYRSARRAELDAAPFWSPNLVDLPFGLPPVLRFSHIETVYQEAKQIAGNGSTQAPR